MMTVLVTVFVTDDDWNRHFNFVRYRFLYMDWNVFLDVYRIGPVDWYFDRNRHWLLDRIGDVFLDWVWRWYWHFYWVGHRFLNVNGHRTINVNFHGIRHRFLNWVGYWFLNRVRHWFSDMYRVRPVDWDLYGVRNLLDDRVRSWDMYRDLYWVRHFLFNRVRSGHMNLNGHMDLFLNWVRFRHIYLNWNWSVNVDVDWVRNFFLNRVGLGYVVGYFDNLFYRVRDMLNNRVGLRDWHFDWVRDFLFDRVGYLFFYRVRYWDFLNHCDSLVDFLVPTVSTISAVSAVSTRVTTIKSAMPSNVG